MAAIGRTCGPILAANSFRSGRMADLAAHPTVKPVALVADAMRDCTRRDDIVLDPFMGAGTTTWPPNGLDGGHTELKSTPPMSMPLSGAGSPSPRRTRSWTVPARPSTKSRRPARAKKEERAMKRGSKDNRNSKAARRGQDRGDGRLGSGRRVRRSPFPRLVCRPMPSGRAILMSGTKSPRKSPNGQRGCPATTGVDEREARIRRPSLSR